MSGHCRGRVISTNLRLVFNCPVFHWVSDIKHIKRTNRTQAFISCLPCSIRSLMLCSNLLHRYRKSTHRLLVNLQRRNTSWNNEELGIDRLSFRSSHCSSRMQVDPVPAPPTVVPEASVPSLPTVGTEPMENTTEPLPVTGEAEQPTFHVMQPPVPTPTVSSEPVVAPPATTYAQLIAVPIASDPAVVATAPTPPVKQTKRVCLVSKLLRVTRTNSFRVHDHRRIISKCIAHRANQLHSSLDRRLEKRRPSCHNLRRRSFWAIKWVSEPRADFSTLFALPFSTTRSETGCHE